MKNFEEVKEQFKSTSSWGLHSSIDLQNCNSETIRDSEKIKEYVAELCKRIGMKTFGETTVVHFGSEENTEGFSMTQLIETSLISGHFANKTDSAYLDIFSCKLYDPWDAAIFTKEFFQAKSYNLTINLRK